MFRYGYLYFAHVRECLVLRKCTLKYLVAKGNMLPIFQLILNEGRRWETGRQRERMINQVGQYVNN